MDEAQGAERLYQREFTAVKGAELLVAFDQGAELRGALAAVATK